MTEQTQLENSRRPLWRRLLGKFASGLIVLAALAVVVFVVAVLPKRSTDQPPTEAPPVNVEVLTIRPVPELSDTFELPGVVEPNQVVTVSAEVAGRIEFVGRPDQLDENGRVLRKGQPVQEGQLVTKGQVLIQLNTDLLQAEADRAKAQAEFDQREHDRVLAARRDRVATKMEVDRARTTMATSKAALDAALAQLKRATITAPITGILDELPVDVGEYVTPGVKVAELVDVRKVKVVLDVPERDVPYLAVGQAEQIFLDNPGTSLAGRITLIRERADDRTRTSRVEITVDNPEHAGGDGQTIRHFRSGRIVRARLARRTLKEVIMIPLQAVIPQEKAKAVYVVVDGKAERRTVELGFIRGWEVQVVRGLSAGDHLMVSGHRYVAPAQRVNATEAGGGAATRPAAADRNTRGEANP